MLTITQSMLSAPDSNGYRHYTLTGNVTGGIRLADNVMDNVVLDGGAFRVSGNGTTDNFGIYSSGNSNLVITNFASVEGFRHLLYLLGADDTTISSVNGRNGSINGLTISGNDVTIDDVTVQDIGGDPDYFPLISLGMRLDGSNITVENSVIANIHGATESVGVGFGKYGTTGNRIQNTQINGVYDTGGSFGVWNNSDGTYIYNSYIHGWDTGVTGGSPDAADIEWSTIADVARLGVITDVGLNNLSVQAPNNSPTVAGDRFDNRLVAGDGNNWVYGASGADHLFGGLGADTFLFVVAQPSFDVISDWQQGIDKIGIGDNINGGFETIKLQVGVHAIGDDPTFYWNQYQKTLWYDTDGIGSDDGTLIAYIPWAPKYGPGQSSMMWV